MTKTEKSAQPRQETAGTLAMLKNVAACMALVEKLRNRGPHLPGIGVLHGPSGYGKSMAAIYAQNKTGARRIEIGESWTRKSFAQALLWELGASPTKGSIADMIREAIMILGDDPSRPLIIDEADKAIDKGFVDLIRELHEFSQAPVLLIGEELLPAKLAASERTHNRVLDWTPAQPCDRDDVRALATLFCPSLAIADDLLEEIRLQSEGRARRIVVNLNEVAEFARNSGLLEIGRAAYAGQYFTGAPPRRSGAAALPKRKAA